MCTGRKTRLDGKTHGAAGGAVIHFPRFVPHGFRNSGNTPARMMFTVIPGANFETFFEDLNALPA